MKKREYVPRLYVCIQLNVSHAHENISVVIRSYVSVDGGRCQLACVMCFLARAAPSGESLRGEGLVWSIGAVVCLLAACRGSNCTLTPAMDGCNLRCSTIGSCQLTATSYDCTARLVAALPL